MVGAQALVQRQTALADQKEVVLTLECRGRLRPLRPPDHAQTPFEDLEITLGKSGEQFHLLEVQAVRGIGETERHGPFVADVRLRFFSWGCSEACGGDCQLDC